MFGVEFFFKERDQPSFSPGGILTPHALGSRSSPGSQVASNPRQAAYEMRMQNNLVWDSLFM